MKKIVLLIFLLINLSGFAQSYYCTKNITLTDCKVNFINNVPSKWAQMNASLLTWSVDQVGSYIIKDGVTQVTIKNDGCLVSPTFTNLDDSLIAWQSRCLLSGGGGDSQTLSISNDTLTISGGNSVILPVYIQIDSSTINSYDVLNSQNAPPGSPSTGDVYLVGTVPTGVWVGQAKDIAEWNGSAWVFTDGVQGDFLYNATNALTYIFRSGNWVQTTGIPALNNGNIISSGLRIGTNNARSLTFETNNVNRGRFDSVGRFYIYDTSLRKANKYLQIDSITGRLVASEISGGGGGPAVDTVSVTYTQLNNLLTNSLLETGKTYIIMDFQTVYDQMDFDNFGALKGSLVTKTGGVEQIWVFALAPNQIASQAYSATYPNDKIQYDWTYNTTLVNGSPAKGRISERIDENNNRTDYDHREIKFIRYDNGAGKFTVINDNGNASGEFLTFVQNFTGGIVKDNWLGDFYSVGALVGQEYANNVFHGSFVVSNTSSALFHTNTFSGDVNSNTFSGEVTNNRFSGEVNNNTFSGYVNNNRFSSNVYSNTFSGGNVNNNTFSGSVVGNTTFSGYVNNNTFSSYVYSSTFSGEVSNNTFSGYVRRNTFSGYVYNNTFSVIVHTNTFSGKVNNNTFSGGDVFNNTFSGYIFNNTFISGYIFTNTFSGEVSYNTFSGNVYTNTFSGNVNSNTFTYTGFLKYVTIADVLQSKTINVVTYPFLFNTDYKKEILKGSNGSNYIRYFDGTNDVNTLIP